MDPRLLHVTKDLLERFDRMTEAVQKASDADRMEIKKNCQRLFESLLYSDGCRAFIVRGTGSFRLIVKEAGYCKWRLFVCDLADEGGPCWLLPIKKDFVQTVLL